MELVTKKRLELIAGRSHPELFEDIAAHLGVKLAEIEFTDFPNGEMKCQFGESLRGTDVFILQTHGPPINDSIMEQLIMIDAAKRASAKRITAVCPYFGYGRQDRKAEGREPITARLLADCIAAAGADRIMSVDLHSGQIQGFFDGPWDHLLAIPALETYLRDNDGTDVVIVAPDVGRLKTAERLAGHLGADLAAVYKKRSGATEVEARGLMGEVAGRHCVLIDDEIAAASTVCAAAEVLVAEGASEIWAMATHGVFSGPAIDRLKNSVISRVVVTNTLPLPPEKQIDKIEVLSAAKILADTIDAVFEDTSVSELFGGENQY